MKIASNLPLFSLWFGVRCVDALNIHTSLSEERRAPARSTVARFCQQDPSSPALPEDSSGGPVLVKQSLFVSAIEAVKNDRGEVDRQQEDETNVAYAIGRLKVNLPVPPGIDLIETPGLVLINGVDQIAYDSGVQPLDTIVGVSTLDGSFRENTNAMSFDEIYKVIMLAIAHARESGDSKIELELNRLVKGFYK